MTWGKITTSNIGKDVYRVMGPGIGGTFEPYRLEVASVAVPQDLGTTHARMAMVPYNDYKVQFRFRDLPSNEYLHQLNLDAESFNSGQRPIFGFEAGMEEDEDGKYLNINAVSNELNENGRIEPDRAGLENGYIHQAMDVQWYSNAVLSESNVPVANYIEHLSANERVQFRQNLPTEGIGAFVVTGLDGTKYHYTLPVYEFDNFTRTEVINDDAYTTIHRPGKFAVLWLLTAITGPDFHDTNANGMADEGDHGRWIRFEYGKFSEAFNWRYPYSSNTYRVNPNGVSQTYQSGKREQYYLDAIHTRTHTALFIKDERLDGKGALDEENKSSNSLKLNNIVLLRNEEYNTFKGQIESRNQSQVDEFNQTNENNLNRCLTYTWIGSEPIPTYIDCPILDSFRRVLDSYDVGTIWPNLLNKSLKSVDFLHSYDLAIKTPNSFSSEYLRNGLPQSTNGKLSLNRITFRGIEGEKYLNDYQFLYGFNPDFHPNKWDAWGMYHSQVVGTNEKNREPKNMTDGTAWSLTSMISPTGVKTEFQLERDTYTKLFGGNASRNYLFSSTSFENGLFFQTIDLNKFQVGETYEASFYFSKYQDGDTVGVNSLALKIRIVDIINTTIHFNYWDFDEVLPDLSSPDLVLDYGWLYFPIPKIGGDVRVKSVETIVGQDDVYHTAYDYNLDPESTSGYTTKEPGYIQSSELPIHDYFDFPQTSVMYSQVSVLTGLDPINDLIDSKTVYNFEAPDFDIIETENVGQYINRYYQGDILSTYYSEETQEMIDVYAEYYLQTRNQLVKIKNSRIGRINQVRIYDSEDHLVSRKQFVYRDQESLPHGLFAEGTILSEIYGGEHFDITRIFRTSKVYYPNILEKIISTNREGIQMVEQHIEWDFITGTPIVTETTTGTGLQTRLKTTPAYKVYDGMGPNAPANGGTHQLAAMATNQVYKLQGGVETGLIGASATEWANDWQENRTLTGDNFTSQPSGYHNYRKKAEWAWMGNTTTLQDDGTHALNSAVDFDFDNPNTAYWEKQLEYLLYDIYSYPIQQKLVPSGIYQSAKIGYDLSFPIIKVANARYEEIAFSGAEEAPDALGYFAGEVKKGEAQRVAASDGHKVHTGRYSLMTTASSQKAFVYKTDQLVPGRQYRINAWTTSTNGMVEYQWGSATVQSVPVEVAKKAGDWYYISGIIEAPANQAQFSLWCRASTGTAYFDDVRLQPLDAQGSAYVYDQFDRLTHVLDNNNLFYELEHDNHGREVRGWKEVFDPATPRYKVFEREYSQAMPFFVNFGRDGNCLKAQVVGDYTGMVQYNWYLDGELITNETHADKTSSNCGFIQCADEIKVEVIEISTGRNYSQAFEGPKPKQPLFVREFREVYQDSPYDDEYFFYLEYWNGVAPYTVEWYVGDNEQPSQSEIATNLQYSQFKLRTKCSSYVYAIVKDYCGKDSIRTADLEIHGFDNNLSASLTQDSPGSKSFLIQASGGLGTLSVSGFAGGQYFSEYGFNSMTVTVPGNCAATVSATITDTECYHRVFLHKTYTPPLLSGSLQVSDQPQSEVASISFSQSQGLPIASGTVNITHPDGTTSTHTLSGLQYNLPKSCDGNTIVSFTVKDECNYYFTTPAVVVDQKVTGCYVQPDCTPLEDTNKSLTFDAVSGIIIPTYGPIIDGQIYRQSLRVNGSHHSIVDVAQPTPMSVSDVCLSGSYSFAMTVADNCEDYNPITITKSYNSSQISAIIGHTDKPGQGWEYSFRITGGEAPYNISWTWPDDSNTNQTSQSGIYSYLVPYGCYSGNATVRIRDNCNSGTNEYTESRELPTDSRIVGSTQTGTQWSVILACDNAASQVRWQYAGPAPTSYDCGNDSMVWHSISACNGQTCCDENSITAIGCSFVVRAYLTDGDGCESFTYNRPQGTLCI